MASSLKNLFRDKSKHNMNQVNGEDMNESEDPYALMNEFRSLYTEKLKAIEENCEDPTDAKVKTLQDWVNDLTEQNVTLLKIVEELEREALDRVNTFNNLAVEAKESIHQDMSAREAEKQVSLEFEKKVAALQEVIQENNLSLDACMKEIDELSKKLEEKSKECNFLRVQNERLEEFHSDVQPYKNDLNNIFEPQEYSIGINAKTTHETSAAVQRLEDLKNQVNKLQNEVREKEESLKRVKSESLQKELEKDNIIKTLEQRLEKAQVDLEVKHDQYLEQKRQKESAEEFNKKIKEEMQSVEATRAQSFKDTDALNSKVNDLESQVKMKKCEISDLKNENQKKEAQICKLESKIEKLKCEIDQVRLNSSKIDELLEKSVCREDSLKSEICRLKKEAECYEKRIKKLEETIKHLEDQLYALQSSSSLDDGCRSQEFNEQVQCLLSTIKAKDIEIENHVAQEKQLCFQITRMESCIKDRERQMSQMSETLKKMSCELRNRSAEMEKLEEQNTQSQQQQIKRIPAKTQSESAVVAAANKQLGTNFHHSLETFQECKNYIHAINELECDFDETDKAILDTWNSFKLWSQSSGDYVLKEFGSLVKLCVEDNEVLAKLATQVGKAVDEKVDLNNGCNLSYLEGNLIELGRYLTKANLATPASDSDLNKNVETDEKGMLSKKNSDVISDSLSLIYGMKRNNQTQVSPKVRSCLEDLMVSFRPILGSKKMFLEKLVSLQQQEVEFVQSFLARVNEFDTGLSAYHNIAENLKNEIRKLFSVLLTKENQIQKQYDEIHNLKALLSSNDRSEHTVDEISNLRKVVSNKDLQLIEKEELIHNLRSLNYTLRRTKLSKSSPSICCSGDLGETLEDRMQQLEDCVLNIKGSLSSILTYLMRCQEKMSVFEEESRNLVHVLAQTHQEITSYKEAVLDGKGDFVNISSLDECLSDAASKVEHLLNAAEIFLCDSEKPDLNFTSEALRRKLMKLVFVVEFIKKNALQEHALIKAIIEENEELKKKVRALEEQIAEEKCLDISGSDKDDLILSLRDSLRKAQGDLEAVHEEYSNLKIQKEDMELRNQKVMEELQAKISTLQESALHNQSSDSECLLQLQRTSENQIQKLKQLEKREEALKNALLIKEQELHLSKKECKDLMNMLNRLRTENINLQSQVNDARLLIRTIQYNFEEKKTENDNLKMQLEEIGNLTELQSMEVDKLQEELLSTTLKYDEVKIAEAMISENYNKLKEEFKVFQEERMNMEKKIFLLQDELTKKTDEITHRQYVLEKQKDNLTKYLEENQTLKMQHEEDEKIRVKLEYELEKLQEDLKAIQDRGRVIAGELVEKKQAIYQLNLEKAKQTSYIRDLETLLKERSRTQYSPDEKGDTNKDIVEEQEEIIEFLTLRIHQMSQYIAERDETIKLIEGQLKASTELMEDDTDPEERRRTNPFSRQTNIDSQRLSAYKVKLQQAMQQNWRLVNMVNRLQSINYTLLSDKTSSSKISRLDIFNDAG